MSMNHKIFGLCCLALGGAGVLSGSKVRLPGDNQGYEPVQPIAFSHRLHAGELAMNCEYCHYGARQSRNAGVPSASVCMNCHKVVTSNFEAMFAEKTLAAEEQREPVAVFSDEIKKIYAALALDEKAEPLPGVAPGPIEWQRVHNLPDFVYFDHRPHVARDIACETCHGPVKTMDRMRQESPLSMGWCLDCHRANAVTTPDSLLPSAQRDASAGRIADHISTNCVTCHL